MEQFLQDWGYLGVFLAIVATGIPGVFIPEELPVVFGGVLVGTTPAKWWIMLPVSILAVILGDSILFAIGRWWGPRALEMRWVKQHLLKPERLARIEDNFRNYGVRILLFARLTPGIRAPIFFTAGMMRLPLVQFLLADGIYAIPGVGLLFFLGYWFGDSILGIVYRAEHFKSILVFVVLGLITVYVIYRFLRKPMVSGAPSEMPPGIGQVTEKLEQVTVKTLEQVSHKIIKPKTEVHETGAEPQAAPAPENDGKATAPHSERIAE